ncbi:MAG: high-potential iron-sulfur protein [Steroidobacteraceae bacterium]
MRRMILPRSGRNGSYELYAAWNLVGGQRDAMGPCTIFPGKSVASAGWCSGWVKKAAA